MRHVPVVHDEAPNTPFWVPLAGLALVILVAGWVTFRVATAEEDPAADTDVTAEIVPAADLPPTPVEPTPPPPAPPPPAPIAAAAAVQPAPQPPPGTG
jgi:hypothetical protein